MAVVAWSRESCAMIAITLPWPSQGAREIEVCMGDEVGPASKSPPSPPGSCVIRTVIVQPFGSSSSHDASIRVFGRATLVSAGCVTMTRGARS